jgi:hypothetical protein
VQPTARHTAKVNPTATQLKTKQLFHVKTLCVNKRQFAQSYFGQEKEDGMT